MKLARILFAAIFALLITHSAFAQHGQANDGTKSAEELALLGYCPVAYVAMNKAMKGDSKFTATYMGHKYLFANADAKKMFEAKPANYVPKYDGSCATAVAMGQSMGADPRYFSTYKGALYLFSNKEAKDMFDKNPIGTIKKAERHWAAISKE